MIKKEKQPGIDKSQNSLSLRLMPMSDNDNECVHRITEYSHRHGDSDVSVCTCHICIDIIIMNHVTNLRDMSNKKWSIFSRIYINSLMIIIDIFFFIGQAILRYTEYSLSSVDKHCLLPGAGFMNRRRLCQLTAAIWTSDLTTHMWVL